jgi:Family of unknown function (DUF6011)
MTDLAKASAADQGAAVGRLQTLLAKLPDARREFGGSLIDQYGQRRSLSDKQWFWVGKLTEMATEEKKPAETHAIGEMAGVATVFALAKQRLSYPAIVLAYGDAELRLSVASERARVPGSINVVVDRKGQEREWIGRILQGGVLEKSRRIEDSVPAELLDLLARFAKDPRRTAAEYGKLTGRCCFCHTGLDDPVSAEAGVGPTCAKNWGMWDDYKAARARIRENTGIIAKRQKVQASVSA